jgi:O-antigen ligase
MKSMKPLHWIGIVAGVVLALFFLFTRLQYFGDITFLGGIFLLEVVIACLWKYDQRFLVLLMLTFLWAGMHIPLQNSWTTGRWVVLATGAVVGYIIWVKNPRRPFGLLHLIALFSVSAAFVSATVSPFFQMASFKALSLFLLFLYCSAGARLAAADREERFFRGLLWGCEAMVFITAVCYLGLGQAIFGNPNSLGAAMSVLFFPVLLWGWLTSDGAVVKMRRLVALLLCTYLIFFSMARAGIASILLVTLIFCIGLHRYRLLVKIVAIMLFVIAVSGMFVPGRLTEKLADLKNVVLYKGSKSKAGGVLSSRLSPWQKSIEIIEAHPWFGTGYGTSPTGDDPGLSFGTIASSSETSREHGSSYMTIAEWVGLVGVWPFAALLVVTVANIWKVCAWMNRTGNPRHYAIPLAMVLLSGLIHASFEDWLFAVGSYLCVYFWVFSFLLADLVPRAAVSSPALVPRPLRPVPSGFGTVVPNS